MRNILRIITALTMIFIPCSVLSEDHKEQFSPLGKVTDIVAGNTALSSKSVIRTDTGVYQVEGAVSANFGDVVQLKTFKNAVPGKFVHLPSVCIKSEIKNSCYRLL